MMSGILWLEMRLANRRAIFGFELLDKVMGFKDWDGRGSYDYRGGEGPQFKYQLQTDGIDLYASLSVHIKTRNPWTK